MITENYYYTLKNAYNTPIEDILRERESGKETERSQTKWAKNQQSCTKEILFLQTIQSLNL